MAWGTISTNEVQIKLVFTRVSQWELGSEFITYSFNGSI